MRYFITLLLCIPHFLPAQNIPNSGFEVWQIGDVVLEAEDWRSSNFYTFNQFLIYSANPDWENFTEGYTSLRLTTSILDTLGPYAGFIISGSPMMDYGTGELDIMSGGTPFPYRPIKMLGQYQFQSQSPIEDFGQAHVILKKYNSVTNQADTVGYGQNVLLNPTVGFQSFEVPIQYFVTDVIPDSIIVIFYSTNPQAPTAGGELWVDELSFDFSTSVAAVNEKATLQLSPNPFQEYIKLEITTTEKGQIELLNTCGQVVKCEQLNTGNQSVEFETSALVPGCYFINWRNEKGECQHLEKAIKIK